MSGDQVCNWCAGVVPAGRRRDAVFCSKRCRQAAWRFRGDLRAGALPDVAPSRAMMFGYADPPYPGQAERYYRDHVDFAGEVDHAALVALLVASHPDGWALSTSSDALRVVLPLCPTDVRVGVWTHGAPPGYTRHARRAWEAVIFHGGRRLPKDRAGGQVLDWIHAGQLRSYPGQIVGTKPPAFCAWVFRVLGALPGDALTDHFPGSGAVQRAWHDYMAEAHRVALSRAGVRDARQNGASRE